MNQVNKTSQNREIPDVPPDTHVNEGVITPPTDRELQQICEIINTNLGFNYNAQKRYLIESRLNKRLTQLGITNYGDYLSLLKEEPLEERILYEYLTTNVTSFFREPAQFEYLTSTLLPKITAAKKEKKIRCWSAGCSSGEEAYSLAIILTEALGAAWDIKVLATDINGEMLQVGMAGEYTEEAVSNIPLKWRDKYFIPQIVAENKRYRVVPALRQKVIFRLMNLLSTQDLPPHIRVDLIFCRNVFIYLNTEARRKVLNHFHRRLRNGGYLFLGHSETINVPTKADPVNVGAVVTDSNPWLYQGKSIYRKGIDENKVE
ncbi:MAG TPA: protein-glutamate O-methyltransferase CheR [Firmicutes bacterium]|jgi:chemotaxis protein methyltransferase CheR|nr:protein-glutamate O-methyltransferase CheR [Bacillota bacterium]